MAELADVSVKLSAKDNEIFLLKEKIKDKESEKDTLISSEKSLNNIS